MNVMDIIDMIDRGEMSASEGISHIKEVRSADSLPSGKGRFMKINVLDKNEHFNFTVPLFLISLGLSAARFGASNSQKSKMDDNAGKALEVIGSLDKKDIKLLVDELRKCKGLNFVEVHSDDSHVSIRIV